ncbi:hypothetical protein AB0I49_07320 [Streptomyces sp. NPDC050617]|uniref:hypothetical protein n=1 Tax=Streptomyces sp. NPDC050617 TaxID=3154628 RepID=UPI0034286A85
MRLWKPSVVVVAALAATPAVLSTPSYADNGYTHGTVLTRSNCSIHANYPRPGGSDWGWNKRQRTPRGGWYHVGVRYTYKNYALVLDYAKAGEPSWGFIAKSCLADRHAYDKQGRRLPDLRAVDGNGKVTNVRMNASHAGKKKRALLRVGAGHVGTLRNAPKSFAIGNVRAGDPFYITTKRCGKHAYNSWVLGYAPKSGRWGYVQAQHLPTCR